jgi:hypothetical protein
MKLFSKRSVVLFAGVMAVCAFAVPSMASAATWGPASSEQTLTSTDLFFTTDPGLTTGSTCSVAQFTATVTATRLDITSATFDRCVGEAGLANCTATPVAQRLPWTATPTTPVVIDGVHISVLFEHKPGVANCPAPGAISTLTGNLQGGTFNDTTHTLHFLNATGLTSHLIGGASSSTTVTGTITDDDGAAPNGFLTLT